MALPKDKVIISVPIDSDIKKFLAEYAKEFDIPLSRFARNLIYVALDTFKLLKKTGIIPILKVFRDLIDRHVTNERVKNSLLVTADKNPVTISVVIDSEVKILLDQYADYLGLPLNILARNLIYIGLDEFKILKFAGFGKLSVLAASFKDFVKSYQKKKSEKDIETGP